jgi:hypothetical protein
VKKSFKNESRLQKPTTFFCLQTAEIKLVAKRNGRQISMAGEEKNILGKE